jgi:hypothetical protein
MLARTLAVEQVLVEKGILTHEEVEARYALLLERATHQFDADMLLQLARFSGPVQ